MKTQKYFLGLDIGTDSIGYAVTDTEYGLLRFKGEQMWGVHLFDEAALNTERRAFRTQRRRLDRRQQRVQLVQELFAQEVAKKDPRFFIRQRTSQLYRDEAGEPYTLFCDENYTDETYHRQYPTIHHLIVDLMQSDAPHDVRLVYLACAWLVAHRGHFLNEVGRDNIEALTDFGAVWKDVISFVQSMGYVFPWQTDKEEEMAAVLKERVGVSVKYRRLAAVLFPNGKAPKANEDFPYDPQLFLKLLCGSKVDLSKLFDNAEYADAGSMSLADTEEVMLETIGKLSDDDGQLILRLKAVNDWTLLVDILHGQKTISEAKVCDYVQHMRDLENLKYLIRTYVPKQYDAVFRQGESDKNYVAYSYHYTRKNAPKKKASQEDFIAYVRKILRDVEPQEKDAPLFDEVKTRLENGVFMPKQKNPENRVIPYQLYWHEMDLILRKAQAYLPFLSAQDQDGLTVREKLMSVFSFRVPYFVGPLNPASERKWFVRRAEGKIYPWNFEQKVDLDASEQAFIRRMTNTCTYLPGEPVLPKESLLYRKFMVLNEINNITIDGHRLPVPVKQEIYNELFLRQRKVTHKSLRNHLINNNYMTKDSKLEGIDIQIHADLKPYHDFARLFSSGLLTHADAERIIERICFTEDRPRLRRWLEREFPDLPPQDVQYISALRYKDFGRLSEAFLTQFPGASKAKDSTGEAFSILEWMWNTNCNLMELLSDDFSFREQIEQAQQDYYAANARTLQERLDEMYISNAVKRPILRTMQIVREVTKAMQAPPAKIFVEMARGAKEEQKNKRTQSRLQQILALYEKCKTEDVQILRAQLDELGDAADSRLRSDVLFLYFMQLGKCMYSGKPLDITQLKSNLYNVDHIIPQSLKKDDSILHNKVLVLSTLNAEKGDGLVPPAVQKQMHGYWKHLQDLELITKEKFKRLTRTTPYSADEKWGFINRQITETSQSTKAVAALLKEMFPKTEMFPETEVVYVKASLVSEFRHAYDCLKSRTFNDLHHAQDAYLNIVVGNVYHMRFTKQWFIPEEKYNIQLKRILGRTWSHAGEIYWNGSQALEKVKKTMVRSTAHMTKYAFCRGGGFFDQMPVRAKEGLVPLKAGLPTEKYGGYNRPTVSFFLPVRYSVGKKSDIMIMSVELLYGKAVLENETAAADYAKKRLTAILGKTPDSVSFPLGLRQIKVGTMLSLDGFRVCIAGSAGGGRCLIAQPFMPFAADAQWNNYLHALEKLAEKIAENPNYFFDPAHEKISAQENAALYDLYIEKLRNSVYAKRPNAPLSTLENGRELFLRLPVPQQARALLAIHAVFGRISSGCDLSLVGGTARAAATVNFSSTISNWKKNYKDVRIIDTAASGLWEHTSQNLLTLL